MGIRAVSGGFLTTVQDMGRYGYQESGMVVSGVMDTRSAALANILAGNDENAAVLEITMMGPMLEFTEDNIVALTGGDLGAELDGVPFPRCEAVIVRAGQTLSFSGLRSGSRAYLAFAGGLDVPPVMGSRSTNLRAKIGGLEGRKLAAGDIIGFCAPRTELPNLKRRRLSADDPHGLDPSFLPGGTFPGECTLRVVMGPQDDCFTEQGLRTFRTGVYTVSNEYDRMGCRMEGEPIEHKDGADIITDGISFGAVQVPAHGRPIVMMADHQTTGGYTKIACVISADLPLLAQCRPGAKIRFYEVTVDEAQELYCRERECLEKLKEVFGEAEAVSGSVEAVSGSVEAVSGSVEAVSGSVEAASERAEAASERAEAEFGRAEAAFGRAETASGSVETALGKIETAFGKTETVPGRMEAAAGTARRYRVTVNGTEYLVEVAER